MQENLFITIFFNIGFAAIIALGVLYNAARISLSERARELASMRVLGFTKGEVAYILLGEMAIVTLVALPVGCLLGYGLAWAWTVSLDTDLYRVPLVVSPRTYGGAVVTVLASAALSGLAVSRRLGRLDMVKALKTRE
jgi:putative ABC transport system permease protein